ncbi:MAG: hotdog fold thioesterase [Deltaproteobacteria bacterium]|nr:hotdog fold thioesterase [Deltaproteobacteria bacterium]
MEKIREFFKKDRFAAHNDITLVEVRPGFAKAELTISDKHLNGVDITHGGAIFTLADLAFAVASNSHGTVAVGVNATISYLKATRKGTLTAEAREVAINPKLATYEVEVRDQNREMVALFQGTVFRKKTALQY